MLHLVQNLVYYMTVEVLEPSWHVMESRIRKVGTMLFAHFCPARLSHAHEAGQKKTQQGMNKKGMHTLVVLSLVGAESQRG